MNTIIIYSVLVSVFFVVLRYSIKNYVNDVFDERDKKEIDRKEVIRLGILDVDKAKRRLAEIEADKVRKKK